MKRQLEHTPSAEGKSMTASKAGLINIWKRKAIKMELPSTLPSSKPWPKISIITPSYNQGKYIEDTILSVLLQNYPNTEHIIIDAVSKDETIEILERYKDQLAKVIIEPDTGQSNAINKGMRLATGEILTWLNSDDMLAPGALAAIAMAFHQSQADLVAGICELYQNGRHVCSHLTSCPDGPLDVRQVLDMDHYWQAGMYFYQPEVMFTRQLWERVGGCLNEDLHFCMDSEMFLRFAKHKARLHVIGRPVAWFRVHDEQKTNNINASPDEFRKVCRDFAEKEGIDLKQNNQTTPALLGCPLNIAMVNDIGFQYGAGIAHKRLSDSLSLAGHNVSHYTLGFYAGKSKRDKEKRINEIVSEIDADNPDLVICGNLHGFTPETDFLVEVLKKWPTALCVHDLWLITGKCPHPKDCRDYLNGCKKNCPSLAEYPQLEANKIQKTWQHKRDALNSSNALLLSNSEWTQSMINNALNGTELKYSKLAMGVSQEFLPYEKRKVRDQLNLPIENFVVLLAAVNINDKSKMGDALKILNKIATKDITVLSLGVANEEIKARYPWLMQLGYIDDPKLLGMIFSAADLHVSFSRTETLGQTFFEAAACGTPSIGYRSTGIVDSVVDGVSGRLIDLDKGNMVEEILKLKKDARYRRDLGYWGAINAENTRSLYYEYYSFYRALYNSGLVPLKKLGRKINFSPNTLEFPILHETVSASGMAQFLSSGWSTISSKGVLTNSRLAKINFSTNKMIKQAVIEVSAHWSVNANIIKRFMAWCFYTFIRKDRINALGRLKRLVFAKSNPLNVKVFLNKVNIGKFTLRDSKMRTLVFDFKGEIIEEANTLTFEIDGVSILSEMGISSECRHLGLRLHRLTLK